MCAFIGFSNAERLGLEEPPDFLLMHMQRGQEEWREGEELKMEVVKLQRELKRF